MLPDAHKRGSQRESGSQTSRLASWRQVAGISEPGTGERVRQRLADRHGTLRDLLTDTIADLDLTYALLDAHFAAGQRSVLHAQLLHERAGSATRRYEYAVARLLDQAVISVTDPTEPRIREVEKPIYVAPPPAKSWLHKLLFGG
jgi:hypothetical protein